MYVAYLGRSATDMSLRVFWFAFPSARSVTSVLRPLVNELAGVKEVMSVMLKMFVTPCVRRSLRCRHRNHCFPATSLSRLPASQAAKPVIVYMWKTSSSSWWEIVLFLPTQYCFVITNFFNRIIFIDLMNKCVSHTCTLLKSG